MKELKEKLARALKAARDIASAAEAENRDYTADERESLKKALDEAAAVKTEIKARSDQDSGLKEALRDLGEDLASIFGDDDKATPTPGPGQAGKGHTAGERFLNSPEFVAWKSQFPGGRIPDNLKGIQSPPVEFAGLKGFKTLITGVSDTLGGALIDPDRLGLRDFGTFQRPLTLRDVVTNGTTGTDAVEYVRVTGFTNAAAPVAEATSSATIGDGTGGTVTAAAGGLKPESAMTLEKITTPVKTIAHWVPATRRALSDAGQLRTLIDSFLMYGLEEELEDQMVNGTGVGENFEGLVTVSGVQAQAWDTNVLTTTRKARTKVRTVGRATANAYVLHPIDWETIDLLQDAENRYYFGGPMVMGQPRLWGLPVIESEAMTQGVGFVADWRMAVLWDREQASISVSDSHADFFVRNLIAILAELRAAFGVIRPSAFVEIDLTA